MQDNVLNLKQETFCRHYVSKEYLGNGTQAYMAAYPWCAYDSAKVMASKLLTNTNVRRRIHDLMDESEINDTAADKALLFTMLQLVDLPSKMRAVEIYNKLKGRYTTKKVDPTVADPMRALMELVLDKADEKNRNFLDRGQR